MAELPDWRNRTVMCIGEAGIRPSRQAALRVRFQEQVYVDDSTGWQVETKAAIAVDALTLNVEDVRDFVARAEEWLALPIQQMGTVFFSGKWEFGDRQKGHQLTIAFGPKPETPSKTDWFEVQVYLGVAGLFWDSLLHVDQTGLSQFVAGLKEALQ